MRKLLPYRGLHVTCFEVTSVSPRSSPNVEQSRLPAKEEGSHVNVNTRVYSQGVIMLLNRQGKAKGGFESFGLK